MVKNGGLLSTLERAEKPISVNKEIEKMQELLNQTLKLISLYKKCALSIPFALKGNLGEFIVAIELLKNFPDHKIDYHGGAFPGVDIIIDDKIKVQVKTQIKHQPQKFRNGYFDYESSPTIKKSILDKKCNVLILVILYLNEDYSKIEKQNIYIFDQSDFKFFSPTFCWSGKSKGDYTIVNVLEVKGEPPPKLKEKINYYNSQEYKRLFKRSKDNWDKMKNILCTQKL